MTSALTSFFELHLSPHGWIIPRGEPSSAWDKKCLNAFIENESKGLTFLTGRNCPPGIHSSFQYWRDVMTSFMVDLCRYPEGENFSEKILDTPNKERFLDLSQRIPPIVGAEYQSAEIVEKLWIRWVRWVGVESKGDLGAFLHEHAPNWTRVGRITLHLAENKNDSTCPYF